MKNEAEDWDNNRRKNLHLLVCGLVSLAATLVMLLASFAFGRDLDGHYAQSPLKPWFDSLRSGKGPCCSDADGSAVSDVDWTTTGDMTRPYKVRIDGEWIPVEATAVITEPNKAGRTMVWPIKGYMGTTIRCFMPGSMG